MCNCGRRREELPDARPEPRGSVVFEYVGRTAMTVTGPYSGRVYRFDSPGARVGVDRRDATSLATISVLRMAAM